MLKEYIGDNPDGSPHFRFTLTQAEMDAGYTDMFNTGPISGVLTLDDGSRYDVTDACIPVKAEHVGQLHVAVHLAHHANGRFLDVPVPALEDVELALNV
jgi:hypothetical protein